MLASLSLLLLVACSGSDQPPAPTQAPAAPEEALPPSGRPDLVLVTIDTLRADRLGAYGDPLARTPNLDELAGQSALFRAAWSPVPLTLPAHASMLTGLYPHRHGLRDNSGYHLGQDVPVVAEALQEAGYHTGAFVAAYVLDAAWGLDRGFEVYGDHFNPQDVVEAVGQAEVERPGREVVREAMAWWDQTQGPRFMWVHLYEPHSPYVAPQGWEGDPYRGEIFEVDRTLRPLLQGVGDQALVMVAGDHGENLWDEGEATHGMLLTRSALRVPLLVRPPGGIEGSADVAPIPVPPRPETWVAVEGLGAEGLVLEAVPDAPVAARVVEMPVSLVDIGATLLHYAGLGCPDCDGRSLAPLVDGQSLPPQPIYSETVYPLHHYGWSPQFAALQGQRMLLQTPDRKLVDPVVDPWLQAPLEEAPEPALVQAIEANSEGWSAAPAPVDADAIEQLEALGYMATVVEPVGEDLPDAGERMDLLNRVAQAQGVMVSAPEQAEAELLAVLEEAPEMADARFSLGSLRLARGDFQGALDAYHEVLERSPTHVPAINNSVVALSGLGRLDEALATVQAMQQANPRDPRWYRHAVSLHAKQEDPAAVHRVAEEGLAQAPDDPYMRYMNGLALLQLNDPAGALVQLGKAREHDTQATDLAMWEGKCHETLGQVDQAVAKYAQASGDMPGDIRPVVAAGMLLARSGRCPEALPFLQEAYDRGLRESRFADTWQRCGGAP